MKYFFAILTIFGLAGALFSQDNLAEKNQVAEEDKSQENVNTDEMLARTPEKIPRDYSDEEIDQMLEDIQEVDDAADIENREDSEPPSLTDDDRALVEDIKNNPEKYAEKIKDMEWLDAHPWAVWSICSDYVWIDEHPRFAARIYLNYSFWSRYPKIGYIIVCNRSFLVRYPDITMVIYSYDEWFLQHPFCAREVYGNYVIFNRYPALCDRYYRHHQWLHNHPGVLKIAYGNRKLFQTRPRYLRHAYSFRRHAVRQHIIRRPHLKKMHDRWMDDASRRRAEKNAHYTRYRYRNNGENRGGTVHTGRSRARDMNVQRDRDHRPIKDREVYRDQKWDNNLNRGGYQNPGAYRRPGKGRNNNEDRIGEKGGGASDRPDRPGRKAK